TVFREAKRFVDCRVPQEILLLKSEPEVVIVVIDSSPTVRRVRCTIGTQNFAHNEVSVFSCRILEKGNRLQKTVGRSAGCLFCRASIEAPLRTAFQLTVEVFHNFGFTSQTLGWNISVQPDVLKF